MQKRKSLEDKMSSPKAKKPRPLVADPAPNLSPIAGTSKASRTITGRSMSTPAKSTARKSCPSKKSSPTVTIKREIESPSSNEQSPRKSIFNDKTVVACISKKQELLGRLESIVIQIESFMEDLNVLTFSNDTSREDTDTKTSFSEDTSREETDTKMSDEDDHEENKDGHDSEDGGDDGHDQSQLRDNDVQILDPVSDIIELD